MTNENAKIAPIAHSLPRAAQVSGISRSKLYEFIKAGKLPIVKIGRRTLVADSDLRTLIDAHRHITDVEVSHEAA